MDRAIKQQIESFARYQLGCNCPDEVFANINIVAPAGELAQLPIWQIYDIGGRLLVVVCEPDNWETVAESLVPVLEGAKRLRDEKGFNRMRLVVPAGDLDQAEDGLRGEFERFCGEDEKLHLHVLPSGVLPGMEAAAV